MTLSLIAKKKNNLRIVIFGVGGAGSNAVDNIISKSVEGVEFVVANTDAQALERSSAPVKIQLGQNTVTSGLGAGGNPLEGAKAAEESIEEINQYLEGAHICFITAGMGGGTGTGAAPIIAQAARNHNILTIGVVTKPFDIEREKRMQIADEGIEKLRSVVDTLLVIPNQNVFRITNENTKMTEALAIIDDVLYKGVKGITDLIIKPGLINLDFADIREAMREDGSAIMGTGQAKGKMGGQRAIEAAENAISNPVLDTFSLRGARTIIISITSNENIGMIEVEQAINQIIQSVKTENNEPRVFFGATIDNSMADELYISIIATGIGAHDTIGNHVHKIKSTITDKSAHRGVIPEKDQLFETEHGESGDKFFVETQHSMDFKDHPPPPDEHNMDTEDCIIESEYKNPDGQSPLGNCYDAVDTNQLENEPFVDMPYIDNNPPEHNVKVVNFPRIDSQITTTDINHPSQQELDRLRSAAQNQMPPDLSEQRFVANAEITHSDKMEFNTAQENNPFASVHSAHENAQQLNTNVGLLGTLKKFLNTKNSNKQSMEHHHPTLTVKSENAEPTGQPETEDTIPIFKRMVN